MSAFIPPRWTSGQGVLHLNWSSNLNCRSDCSHSLHLDPRHPPPETVWSIYIYIYIYIYTYCTFVWLMIGQWPVSLKLNKVPRSPRGSRASETHRELSWVTFARVGSCHKGVKFLKCMMVSLCQKWQQTELKWHHVTLIILVKKCMALVTWPHFSISATGQFPVATRSRRAWDCFKFKSPSPFWKPFNGSLRSSFSQFELAAFLHAITKIKMKLKSKNFGHSYAL